MPDATEPRIAFVIGGVQKAGTSALAHYLARHPRLRLPLAKEAHVFDAPDYDERASPAAIDARLHGLYAPMADDGGAPAGPAALHGDATPFYVFHPAVPERIARYNPRMRWIILLRDPVERALSHYRMERERGNERWPLWAALLLERWRLARDHGGLQRGSVLRRHSYRARGDYEPQLQRLLALFPREQVMLLRSEDLRTSPEAVVGRVCAFLGVQAPAAGQDYPEVFVGPRTGAGGTFGRLFATWLLRRESRAFEQRRDFDWP